MWPGRNNVPLLVGITLRCKENCAVNSGISAILTVCRKQDEK